MSELDGGELKPDLIWETFVSEFVDVSGPYKLIDYKIKSSSEQLEQCAFNIKVADSDISLYGEGSGPIDAFIAGLVETLNEPLNVLDYQEYSLYEGSEAQAICILAITDDKQNKYYGVGISQNTTTAAFEAIIAAINRKWQ